jgi:phosphatidylglycerol:prolipoprotein diacylglycerol transferase
MINLHESTVLFSIGTFSVQTWGSLVALGMLISIFFILKEAKKRNILDKSEQLLIFIMLSGIICGRIAYILNNLSEFPTFFSFFELWQGGIISYGVLIGVIIGAFLFKFSTKTTSKEFFDLLDIFAPYLILAIAIGRIGCFLRGCCFGIPSNLPWAVVYSGESLSGSIAVHPTQIYHAIADFIIFFILLRLYKKKEHLNQTKKESKFEFFSISGSIFLLYLILYSAERFFIDFFRYHPINEYFGRFSITQWIFLAIFIVSLVILNKKRKRK